MRIIVVPIYFLEHKSKSLDLTQGMKIESMNDIFFEDVFPCKDTRETSSNKRTHDTRSVLTQSEDGHRNVGACRAMVKLPKIQPKLLNAYLWNMQIMIVQKIVIRDANKEHNRIGFY